MRARKEKKAIKILKQALAQKTGQSTVNTPAPASTLKTGRPTDGQNTTLNMLKNLEKKVKHRERLPKLRKDMNLARRLRGVREI